MRFILSIAVLQLFLSTASAAIVTAPTDLSVGDEYRLVFVTNGRFAATSADASFYDAAVNEQVAMSPELVALGTTWNAIVSTPTDNARDLTSTIPATDGAGIVIYNVMDQRLANNYQGFWPGFLGGHQAPVRFDQFGNEPPGNILVWTGTSESGISSSGGLGSTGLQTQGHRTSSSFQWIRGQSSSDPNSLAGLYGISGVLTVTAVPEPSTTALLLCVAGLGVFAWYRKHRRGRAC